jgi:hypothetical protein
MRATPLEYQEASNRGKTPAGNLETEHRRSSSLRLPRENLRGLDRARRQAEQLIAISVRQDLEPTLAGAEKTPLVGKAEHVGRLRRRQIEPAEPGDSAQIIADFQD